MSLGVPMKIEVENAYSDGHESVLTYGGVPEFTGAVTEGDDWELSQHLHEYTGDGHGAEDPDLGFFCVITILAAANPALVGRTVEWDG